MVLRCATETLGYRVTAVKASISGGKANAYQSYTVNRAAILALFEVK